MLDDYLKTNPGVKDLPRLGIEHQPPSHVVIGMHFTLQAFFASKLLNLKKLLIFFHLDRFHLKSDKRHWKTGIFSHF